MTSLIKFGSKYCKTCCYKNPVNIVQQRNIISFFSFPFNTQNVHMGRVRESKTAALNIQEPKYKIFGENSSGLEIKTFLII